MYGTCSAGHLYASEVYIKGKISCMNVGMANKQCVRHIMLCIIEIHVHIVHVLNNEQCSTTRVEG